MNNNLANKRFINIDRKQWFYIIIIWAIISLCLSFILGGIFYAVRKKKDDQVTFFGMTTEFISSGFYLGLVGIILTVLYKEYNISIYLYLIGTILLFISVGGLHGMFLKVFELKKTYSKLIYYSVILILGAIFYLKFI